MNYEELLEMLEIDEPSQLEYFENIADIMECEEDIDESALTELFSGADSEKLSGIIKEYFDDAAGKMPDSAVDIYTVLTQVGMSLTGLANEIEDRDSAASLAEELLRFKKWYMFDTEVSCIDTKTGDVCTLTLAEALAEYRLDMISGSEHEFDFSECGEYELDEYIMSFSDIAASESEDGGREIHEFFTDDDDDDEDDDCDCGCHDHDGEHHHHHHKTYDESILDEGFVYDDEFKDLD